MLAPWVIDEMKEADLHDRRLNRRLNRILSDLAEHPTASIPAACGGKAETIAAYRFFDNDQVAPQEILHPHATETRQRIAAQPVAIFIPDTTEIDLTRPQQQVVGSGPLDDGSRRGVLLHLIGAFSADGTPLGTVWTQMWARPDADASGSKLDRKRIPIEEKESLRWLESLRRVREVAAHVPGTQCLLVADSESDIYEVLAEPRGATQPVDWIIRACHDRATVPAEDETARQLRAAVSGTELLFTQKITMRAHQPKTACEERKRRKGRSARTAVVEVRSAEVELRPPWRPDRKLPPVRVNVVQVREVDPPAGEEAIEWILITTLSIDTIDDVRAIIQYYTIRWMIEMFHPDYPSSDSLYRRDRAA